MLVAETFKNLFFHCGILKIDVSDSVKPIKKTHTCTHREKINSHKRLSGNLSENDCLDEIVTDIMTHTHNTPADHVVEWFLCILGNLSFQRQSH